MKFNKKMKWILFVIVGFVITSCSNDFLEEEVDNRTLISTLEEMEATVAGLTPKGDALFTEFMTDNYVYKDLPSHTVNTVINEIRPAFTFQITKESLPNSDYPTSSCNSNISWRRYYYRLQNAFLIIDKANKYITKGDDEKEQKETIIGQCLAIKAYCNFMLVNLFAKPYDVATAANDAGIPLVKEYTGKAIETYPIVTVQETYDAIEKDLLEASTLLKNKKIENSKFKFTSLAVDALLAKFYLFKQDWVSSVKYADLTLNENSSLLDIREFDFFIDPAEISKQFFNPDNKSYILMSEDTREFISYFRSGFYPYPLDAFMVQQGRFLSRQHDFIQTSPLFGDIIPIKMLFFYNRRNTSIPLLSVDEVYYNKVEANIQLGNFADAKSDLKLLLDKDDYYNDTWTGKLDGLTDKEALINYLLDSKRMRFYGEGIRWFDMRRYGIPVTHQMLSTKQFIIDGTKPEDYVIKAPLEEIDARNN